MPANRIRSVLIAIVAATPLSLAPAAVSAPPAKADHRMARLSEAPKVDGKGDDACWAGVPETRAFHRIQGRDATPEVFTDECSVRIGYTDTHLYMRIEAFERDMSSLWVKSLPGNWQYLEDNVEIFLDSNRDLQSYWLWIVNSAGFVRYSRHGATPARRTSGNLMFNGDPPWPLKVGRTDRSYVIELSVPLTEMDFGGSPGTMGLCVIKNSFSQKKSYTFGGKHHTPKTWAPVGGLGPMNGTQVWVREMTLDDWGLRVAGENLCRAILENRGAKSATVVPKVLIGRDDERWRGKPVTLAPGQTHELEAIYTLPSWFERGSLTVLVEEAGRQYFRRSTFARRQEVIRAARVARAAVLPGEPVQLQVWLNQLPEHLPKRRLRVDLLSGADQVVQTATIVPRQLEFRLPFRPSDKVHPGTYSLAVTLSEADNRPLATTRLAIWLLPRGPFADGF